MERSGDMERVGAKANGRAKSEMGEQPLISVIIPVYNMEKYLRDCLDSVLAQTYQRLEIILVDDGSTDAGSGICDTYAQKDTRIRVFHKANAGPAAARNTALDSMTGEYVAFLDADDFVHREYMEQLLRPCLKQGADVTIGDFCEVGPEDEPKGIADRRLSEPEVTYMTGREACARLYGARNQRTLWLPVKLIRSELLENRRIPDWRIHEDTAFTWRYLYHTPKVAYTNAALYFYRVNPDSAMHSRFSEKFFSILPILDEQIQFYLERREDALAARTAEVLCWYILDYYQKTVQSGENAPERKSRLKKAMKKLCRKSFSIKGVLFKHRMKYILAALFPDKICRFSHPN